VSVLVWKGADPLDGFGLRFPEMTAVPHPAHGTAWTMLGGCEGVNMLATLVSQNSDDAFYILSRGVPETEMGRNNETNPPFPASILFGNHYTTCIEAGDRKKKER